MTSPSARMHRLRRRGQRPTGHVSRYLLAAILIVLMAVVFPVWLFFGSLVAAWTYYSDEMPSPEAITARPSSSSVLIYDRNGQLLHEFIDPQYGRRHRVPLGEISPYLVQATIATEDHDFYLNSGINLKGILRALYHNLTSGGGDDEEESIQGGSSITQQLVKNALIPEDERTKRSVSRKIKEVLLSYALTRRYSKDQILEWYFNEIYYGNLSYGIEAAAQSYFGKSARDLTLAEAAMLAGLPQAPARYSPLTNPEQAKQRQQDVLGLMVRQGFITPEEADAAAAEDLTYQPLSFPIKAPHFVMYVRDLLERKYGARGMFRQGLKVTTSLDFDFNAKVEQLLRDRMKAARSYGASNGAVVAIRPQTGEILAMVGSVDYFDRKLQGQVNVATMRRSPGSSFKPYMYLAAFLKGWNPNTIVLDAPINIGGWSPKNNDGSTRGRLPVRLALGNSLNIPAVRAIMHAGVEFAVSVTRSMGVSSLSESPAFYGPPVAIGAGEITLLDHTFGFATFANNGRQVGAELPPDLRKPGFPELEPAALLKVEDMAGNVLEEHIPSERQVVPPEYAYMITHVLKDQRNRVAVFGASTPLYIPEFEAAAKSGTSENNKDNLIMGYTRDLALGTWMGNNNGRPMSGSAYGVTTIGPLWRDIMRLYHKDREVTPFERPPGPIPGVDDGEAKPDSTSQPAPRPRSTTDSPRRQPQRSPAPTQRPSTQQQETQPALEPAPQTPAERLRERRQRSRRNFG
ncbi:MAG: transglycosylase domain-containing protein [Chloroflexi bacterium]|nr:transglycosylase domain-containing protein [Chloroflexota bacterium]